MHVREKERKKKKLNLLEDNIWNEVPAAGGMRKIPEQLMVRRREA